MTTLQRTLIASLVCLAGAASAAPVTKADYTANKTAIAVQYTADKAACKSMAGNAKDICQVEAKGKDKVAKAELEASYQPSTKHAYGVRAAKADAAYETAKEKCDDLAGNPKDVCRKEAKAAHVVAKDAAADKRQADYAVAKEKCDALAGTVKDTCVTDAKTKFGQM